MFECTLKKVKYACMQAGKQSHIHKLAHAEVITKYNQEPQASL
jgi:hypothetical protein